jgi:hypothetical protein
MRGTGRSDPIDVTVDDARTALELARGEMDIAEPVNFTAGENLKQLVARSR